LLNNFDQDVVDRVRVQSTSVLDRTNEELWTLTKFALAGSATFDDESHTFELEHPPSDVLPSAPAGRYVLGRDDPNAISYRVGHELAKAVVNHSQQVDCPTVRVRFDYTASGRRISILDGLVGRSGWICASVATIQTVETEDLLIAAGIVSDGSALDPDQASRLLGVPAEIMGEANPAAADVRAMEVAADAALTSIADRVSSRNASWFEIEMDKLDRWANDRRTSVRTTMSELSDAIKEAKRAARLAPTLPEKLERQRALRNLESRHDEAVRQFEATSREIEREKDRLLDDVTERLKQQMTETPLFTIHWEVA
jgi:hypothetical protein